MLNSSTSSPAAQTKESPTLNHLQSKETCNCRWRHPNELLRELLRKSRISQHEELPTEEENDSAAAHIKIAAAASSSKQYFFLRGGGPARRTLHPGNKKSAAPPIDLASAVAAIINSPISKPPLAPSNEQPTQEEDDEELVPSRLSAEYSEERLVATEQADLSARNGVAKPQIRPNMARAGAAAASRAATATVRRTVTAAPARRGGRKVYQLSVASART